MGSTARLGLLVGILLFGTLLAGACARRAALTPTPPAELSAPLRLLGHDHRAEELLVFERPGSRGFVAAVLAVLERINGARPTGLAPIGLTVVHWRRDRAAGAERPARRTPVRRVAVDTRLDVWLQDVVEIGAAGHGPDARPVLLAPYRPGGLASLVPELALAWGADWIRLERAGGAGPDGGGNVEALPGDVLLLGSTAGPSLTGFLLEQGYAGRHVRVDTSWLWIGHVDELVSHVITGAGDCGFALVRASPALGLALAWDDPHAPAWLRRRVGRPGEPTHFVRVQQALEERMRAAVAQIRRAVAARTPACAHLPEIPLPVVFECNGPPEAPRRCWPSLPNPVNLTVLDRHVLVPDPGYGPFRDTVDELLRTAGQVPHLLDAGFYQDQLGGVHCATNVRRHPASRLLQ